MEMLYNPENMSEEEIKETFVARKGLIDDLIELVKNQPDGAGVQHVVIIGPRGMGKTTVLLMLRYALIESGLINQWQAVKFPEESYGIYDLADFWLKTLSLLAIETEDTRMNTRIEHIQNEYSDNDKLQEAALAMLKDWRKKHSKRLLLLVDNFDMILEQINDELDNARLRDILMNDGTIMIVGGAMSFFEEVRSYEQPLYNFFKTYDLYRLKFKHVKKLLFKRANIDKREGFAKILEANESKVRALEYFTGGNPRLILMLYRVITESSFNEVRKALEKLLDEVTPYYKAKTETLPAQQRKIMDCIARTSGKTNEGITPTDIASATRLKVNQVSAQLKRLAELGYVLSANIRGRSSFYTLSEPLYAIWYQMRFSKETKLKMTWLINFLSVWYEATEINLELNRLDISFQSCIQSGYIEKAHDVLEHSRYLMEAMEDTNNRTSVASNILKNYMQIGDIEHIKELIDEADLNKLSDDQFKKLINELETKRSIPQNRILNIKAKRAFNKSDFKNAIDCLNLLIKDEPDSFSYWYNKGSALFQLERYMEALKSFEKVLEIKPKDHEALYNRGLAFAYLSRFEEALKSFDKAIEIKPDMHEAWGNRGNSLLELNRLKEAIESYDKVLEIKKDDHLAWGNRGNAFAELGQFDDAVESYEKALAIKPDFFSSWYNLTLTLLNMVVIHIKENRIQDAKKILLEAKNCKKKIGNDKWIELLLQSLLPVAISDKVELLKDLINNDVELNQAFFPLLRAVEYLQTGNEELIEKLTPEYKGIVKEVAEKLKKEAIDRINNK